MDCAIVAGSVDSREHAREVVDSNNLTFSMAHGVTREESARLGAWWSDDRGGYIQPAEFLLVRGGVILGSLYASGPVGRMGVDEAIRQITNRERRRIESEDGGS